MTQEAFEKEVVVFVAILIIYVLTSHWIQVKKVPFIHEATIAIIMGLLMAVFAKYALEETLQFQSDFFFTLILPPIIFSAGYSLRKGLFFDNFWMISFLGVVGTIIAFIFLACTLFLLNYFFAVLNTSELLMLSAILCATDTVAAVSLIKPQKYPVLNAVLFGEGVINDAVAIILFRTVQNLTLDSEGSFTFGVIVDIFFGFLYLCIFSLVLGLLFGFGLTYIFKVNESFLHTPIKQTSLILLSGYFSYLLGELLGLSGIITLFTNAVVMGHYCFMNISEESKRGTGLAFETVGYMAEAFVFAYLGTSILSTSWTWSALLMSLLCLLAFPMIRGIMVYFLPCIYAFMKKPFPIKQKQLKVCWFSGMVRGVIAYALCLQVHGEHSDFIQNLGLIIVLITTVLGSSMLKPFSNYIGLQDSEQQNVSEIMDEKLNPQSSNYHSFGPPSDKQLQPSQSPADKFRQLQNKYIKPIFERKNQPLTYELENNKQQL